MNTFRTSATVHQLPGQSIQDAVEVAFMKLRRVARLEGGPMDFKDECTIRKIFRSHAMEQEVLDFVEEDIQHNRLTGPAFVVLYGDEALFYGKE